MEEAHPDKSATMTAAGKNGEVFRVLCLEPPAGFKPASTELQIRLPINWATGAINRTDKFFFTVATAPMCAALSQEVAVLPG